ncbi:hypothetical protein ACWEXN_04575 [Staphylococcus xylosus]
MWKAFCKLNEKIKTLVIIFLILILAFILGILVHKIGLENPIEVSLLFLGLFATFGGAYLGAKIAGDNARELEIDRRKNEIEEKILKIRLLFKMNLDNVSDIHMFFCSYYDIKQIDFLSSLKKKRSALYGEYNRPLNLSERNHIKFLEEFMMEWKINTDWHNPIFSEINNFKNLFSEVSSQMIYFKEEDLNTIFQLKQVLTKLEYYIIFNEEEKNYTLKQGSEQEFESFKALFMLFSLLYIDLTEGILGIEIK